MLLIYVCSVAWHVTLQHVLNWFGDKLLLLTGTFTNKVYKYVCKYDILDFDKVMWGTIYKFNIFIQLSFPGTKKWDTASQ